MDQRAAGDNKQQGPGFKGSSAPQGNLKVNTHIRGSRQKLKELYEEMDPEGNFEGYFLDLKKHILEYVGTDVSCLQYKNIFAREHEEINSAYLLGLADRAIPLFRQEFSAIMSEQDFENMFQSVVENKTQKKFAKAIKHKLCILPMDTKQRYYAWLKQEKSPKPKNDDVVPDSKVIENVESEKNPLVNIIPVDRDFVKLEPVVEMLAKEQVERHEEKKSEFIPHIYWIAEAVRRHFKLDKVPDVYSPKPGKETPQAEVRAHSVIEFKDSYGQKHQIVTNNWYAGGTYVLKEPVDIVPDSAKLVHIKKLLLDDKTAFPVRCLNQKQYTNKIIEICETDLDELEYVPHISWPDKKEFLIASLRAHIIATGKIPKANDDGAMGFGPLRGITTWARAYQAVRKKGVSGLEHIDNLKTLYDDIVEKEPELAQHLGKPTVSAVKVFNDAVRYMKANDMVLQSGFLDGVTLQGWDATQVDAFFKGTTKGCVIDLSEVVQDRDATVNSIDDFMVASGLAYKKEGSLHPDFDHPVFQEEVKRGYIMA